MAEPTTSPEPTADPTPAPAVDVQAEIQKALADQQAQFQTQLKEATGFDSIQAYQEAQMQEKGQLKELLDSKSAELQSVTQKFQQTLINNALLSAAADAVDPDTVVVLLSNSAQVDENGNVLVEGKAPAEAVKALLEAKPFLAKATGNQGGGSPQNTEGGKSLSRAAFDALDPAAKQQFFRDGGTVTD
jgi:hypothetical protein